MRTEQRRLIIPILSLILLTGTANPTRDAWCSELRGMSQPLVDAVRQGQVDRVRNIIAGDPGLLESRGEWGFTPLMLAAFLGDQPMLSLLLEAGADVQATNDVGGQALFYAANDLKKMRLLVEAGADVNHATRFGHTPLFTAVRSAFSLDEVRYLIEHGAKVNIHSGFGVTPLSVAAQTGNIELVRLLIKHGADPTIDNKPSKVELDDGTTESLMLAGGSALDKAINVGHLAIARLLHDAGSKSPDPLFLAQFNHQAHMVRFAVDELGAKPRDFSVALASDHDFGNDEELRIILEAGADPNSIGEYPLAALMGVPQSGLLQARRRGNTPVVKALVAAGAREQDDWWADKQRDPPKREVDPTKLDCEDLIRSILGATPLLERTITQGPAIYAQYTNDGKACLSCHNQLLPLTALATAKNKGVPVDPENFANARQTVESFSTGTQFAKSSEVTFDPSSGHSSTLEIWAMLEAGIKPSSHYDGELHTIAQSQMYDGRWATLEQRVPLMGTDVTPTAWAIRALAHYPMPGRRAEFTHRIEKAKQFLLRTKPRSAEEAAHKILGLYWAGLTPDQLQDHAAVLLKMQKEDGGWTSSPYLEQSDSYGTGQALYALSEAMGVGLENQAYREGVAFLLRTQLGDGSWFVRRRAVPIQATMQTVFPHGRDAWISATGTSWAVLALASSLDESDVPQVLAQGRPIGFASIEPEVAELPVAFPDRVIYSKDIEPMIDTSCIGCHGDKSIESGMYSMNSRADLIRGNHRGPNVVIPGDSAISPLIKHVAGLIEDVEMPPLPHRDDYEPLTAEQISKLRRWIDDGLPGLD